MKKVISAILAGAMCAGAFTACGDKKDDKKSSGLSTKCDGEYVSITPFDGKLQLFRESIDEGIEYSKNYAEDYEKENIFTYNPHLITFSDGEFHMPDYPGYKGWMFLEGKFSVKDRKINFSYENYINLMYDSKMNVNDDSESIDDNIPKMIDRIRILNESGSFLKIVVPGMNCSDKWSDFSVLPFIRFARGNEDINYDYPNTLYAVDDFLCTDTYGIELDGKYKRGKAFTLKHDLEDVVRNDVQSHLLGYEDNAEELIDKAIERAKSNYNCDDVETTIEFSDGEWEWFNADGGLINNGRYDESKDYPGLIMMYLDEDSKNCPDYALYTYPLWFYIADDGEIYYPGYVKMD